MTLHSDWGLVKPMKYAISRLVCYTVPRAYSSFANWQLPTANGQLLYLPASVEQWQHKKWLELPAANKENKRQDGHPSCGVSF